MRSNASFDINSQINRELVEKVREINPELIDAIQGAADIASGRKKVGALFDKVGNFEKALRDATRPTDLIKLYKKIKILTFKRKI